MSAKCDWCGRSFDATRAYHVGKVGKAVGAFKMANRLVNWINEDHYLKTNNNTPFVNEFCSQRCADSYKAKISGSVSNNHKQDSNFQQNDINIELQNKRIEADIKIKNALSEFELEKAKQEYTDERRVRNLQDADEYLKNGGNKFLYYLKCLWAHLDKTWKKVVFLIIVWQVLAFLYL
jgi:hypothetical protein